MAKPKVKHLRIPITVTSAGQVIPIDAETDKLYNTCTGIDIMLTDENALFSTIQLDINNTEVFSENTEILRIKFKEQAPTDFDYYHLNEPAGGSKVKGSYTDSGSASYPYTAIITIQQKNISTTDTGSIS